MLKKSSYGLIISDWSMEPMSGIDLLREVRGDPKLKHIPFIMITAESKSKNAIQAKEAGVSTYIVKPFNLETLKARLISVLGDYRRLSKSASGGPHASRRRSGSAGNPRKKPLGGSSA